MFLPRAYMLTLCPVSNITTTSSIVVFYFLSLRHPHRGDALSHKVSYWQAGPSRTADVDKRSEQTDTKPTDSVNLR